MRILQLLIQVKIKGKCTSTSSQLKILINSNNLSTINDSTFEKSVYFDKKSSGNLH